MWQIAIVQGISSSVPLCVRLMEDEMGSEFWFPPASPSVSSLCIMIPVPICVTWVLKTNHVHLVLKGTRVDSRSEEAPAGLSFSNEAPSQEVSKRNFDCNVIPFKL